MREMHVLRNLPGMKIPAGAGAALRLSVIGAVVAVFLCGFAVSPHADADPESASLVKWVPCPGHEEVQCSELSVPLDPAAPELGTISLALARRPATDPSARIGSLVLEPGGPGLSGVEEVLAGDELSTPEVAARYDIVGFDPRGVGRSEPLWCFTEEQIGRYLDELAGVSWDLDPSTPQVAAFAQTAASFGQGCQADNPALLQRVGTRYAAADLDLIRAALGDEKLNYLGWSYGTKLGAIYADMFPHRVGRMVLDSAIDPALSLVEFNQGQSAALESALGRFFDYCSTVEGCPLPPGREAATAALKGFLLSLPVDRVTPETLTRADVMAALTTAMYDPGEYFPQLTPALADGINGHGRALQEIGGNYGEQKPDEPSNFLNALYAINCFDSPPTPDVVGTAQLAADWDRNSPIFGAPNAWGGLRCNIFPAHSQIGPRPVSAPGAPPILIIGAVRDAATPIEWSRRLADDLASAVLIQADTDVHSVYPQASSCVATLVDRYLLSGEAPPGDTACAQ